MHAPSLNKDLLRSIGCAGGRRCTYVGGKLLESVILGKGHPPKLTGCVECIVRGCHRAMGRRAWPRGQVKRLVVLWRRVVVEEERHVLRLAGGGVDALCIPRVGRARGAGGPDVGVGRPEVGLERGVRQIVVWRGVGGGEEVCVERGCVGGGGGGGGAGVRGGGRVGLGERVVLVEIRAAKYVLGGHARHDGVRRVRARVRRRRRADRRRARVRVVGVVCRGGEVVERRGGRQHVHACVHRHAGKNAQKSGKIRAASGVVERYDEQRVGGRASRVKL